MPKGASGKKSFINSPIEAKHAADVVFGRKKLNRKQQALLDTLPDYGSRVIVNKRDVSMRDLAVLTAATGDEFAMFTKSGKRLIIRGNAQNTPLYDRDIIKLRDKGYRLSGHTHPGIRSVNLTVSDGDIRALKLLRQTRSVIYNAVGKHRIFESEG